MVLATRCGFPATAPLAEKVDCNGDRMAMVRMFKSIMMFKMIIRMIVITMFKTIIMKIRTYWIVHLLSISHPAYFQSL